MKFFVDECVGPSVAQWLKQNNFNAISVYDDLPGISDNEVLDKALSEDRILITNDKDFGEMIFKSRRQHCGVILLRLSNEKQSNKIMVLENLLKDHAQDLFGNFVVVTEQSVRITKLHIFN